MYDVHRRIPEYLNREDFREAVKEFANLYGCWFSASVGSKAYKLHHVDEWRNEWEEVVTATTELKPEFYKDYFDKWVWKLTIENKLNEFTNMSIDKSGRIDIRPMSIGGWVWSLIYKDYYDKTTYTPCSNPKCTRELPSLSPTTKRKMKYCSQSCKNAVHYRVKTRKGVYN
tara:strand:- start:812 stop:1324 length:513 start_codon:yes stop_codon:yes gene_type:complete